MSVCWTECSVTRFLSSCSCVQTGNWAFSAPFAGSQSSSRVRVYRFCHRCHCASLWTLQFFPCWSGHLEPDRAFSSAGTRCRQHARLRFLLHIQGLLQPVLSWFSRTAPKMLSNLLLPGTVSPSHQLLLFVLSMALHLKRAVLRQHSCLQWPFFIHPAAAVTNQVCRGHVITSSFLLSSLMNAPSAPAVGVSQFQVCACLSLANTESGGDLIYPIPCRTHSVGGKPSWGAGREPEARCSMRPPWWLKHSY